LWSTYLCGRKNGKFEIERIRESQIRNPKTRIGRPRAPSSVAVARKGDDIHQRLISFGSRITRVARMLPRTDEGRYICRQLLRSGLAAAPNYAEARAAESRADFIHKLRIVLKELNETKSWLEQIVANTPRLSRKIRNSAGSLRPRLRPPEAQTVQFDISGFRI
jgi:four helix bundle protein